MKGMLATDQNRTTTRNFRIPLSLDDKILELNKELGHSTMTETWIYLVKIGMEQEDKNAISNRTSTTSKLELRGVSPDWQDVSFPSQSGLDASRRDSSAQFEF